MANGKNKNKKLQKCGSSVAENNVEQNCRWPLWDGENKQIKRGVNLVKPGVFCHPSRRTKRGAGVYAHNI